MKSHLALVFALCIFLMTVPVIAGISPNDVVVVYNSNSAWNGLYTRLYGYF